MTDLILMMMYQRPEGVLDLMVYEAEEEGTKEMGGRRRWVSLWAEIDGVWEIPLGKARVAFLNSIFPESQEDQSHPLHLIPGSGNPLGGHETSL